MPLQPLTEDLDLAAENAELRAANGRLQRANARLRDKHEGLAEATYQGVRDALVAVGRAALRVTGARAMRLRSSGSATGNSASRQSRITATCVCAGSPARWTRSSPLRRFSVPIIRFVAHTSCLAATC